MPQRPGSRSTPLPSCRSEPIVTTGQDRGIADIAGSVPPHVALDAVEDPPPPAARGVQSSDAAAMAWSGRSALRESTGGSMTRPEGSAPDGGSQRRRDAADPMYTLSVVELVAQAARHEANGHLDNAQKLLCLLARSIDDGALAQDISRVSAQLRLARDAIDKMKVGPLRGARSVRRSASTASSSRCAIRHAAFSMRALSTSWFQGALQTCSSSRRQCG